MSPAIPGRREVRRLIPRPLRHALYDVGLSRRRRWARVPGIETVRGGGVVLTFDDGPDPAGTPAVLDALDRIGARATFFMVGAHVAAHPDLTREVRDRGHELALHGMTHRRHDGLTVEEARTELGAGAAEIERATGAAPRWYRPPFGRSSEPLAAACAELGLGLAYWSSWGFDWESLGGGEIARIVNRDLDPGAIVLLHDCADYAEREDPAPTAEALIPIGAAAAAAGLAFRTLGEAVGGDGA